MTSSRPRSVRPSPPISSHEAALLGALTAFAKSPPTAAGNVVVNKPRPAPVPPGKKPHLSTRPTGVKANIAKDPSPSAKAELTASNESVRTPKTPKRSEQDLKAPLSPVDPREVVSERSITPIPSTNSLIQLYEKQQKTSASSPRTLALQSPKPTRPASLLIQKDDEIASSITKQDDTNHNPPQSSKSDKTDISSTASFTSARDFQSPLQDRRVSSEAPSSPKDDRKPSDPVPIPRKSSGPTRKPSQTDHIAISSSLGNQNLHPGSFSRLYNLPSAANSTASITATYNALHPRRQSVLRTGDSLANAIVASSLASSRAPSPMMHPSHHSNGTAFFSRTPSPHKHQQTSTSGPSVTLRQTLRPPRDSDSDSSAADDPYAKHKRKRHIRKHANKYHEGDRKRWRNAVTARERSRYEGLWAANRASLPGTPAECVHALAVKELWGRSRLAAHVLQEIWGLVAQEGVPWLGREEFVVGLWLVDQRLKGRKLPVRVGGSVWESVRVVKGIRIRHRELGTGKW